MKLLRNLFVALATLSLSSTASLAKEAGGFMVWLGRDTTGVERYMREDARLVVDQVGRSPRVLSRHFEYELGAGGALKGLSVKVTNPSAPAGAPPLQLLKVTPTKDSILVEVRRDSSVQTIRVAAPSGTVVVSLSSPWVMYESVTMKLAAGKAKRLQMPMYILGAGEVDSMTVRRLDADSMEIVNPEGVYHILVDKAGHIVHVTPIKGTAQFTVQRMPNVDLAAFTAQYSAREAQAGMMGALSTRDTVRVENAGGAQLWIDYGRPSKRGRVVYGGVVPFGELWRTGANAATQFRTDKTLKFGDAVMPAGFYTLWTIPSPSGWKLIVNSETGQWGTAHQADKDLLTLDMSVSALSDPVERFTISVTPAADGGVIHLDWDTTRASLPFTVQP
ncbi:MAG: DUF2911 domain-containing protein [Candidatus Eiseniibacteriota bacterium]